MGGESPSDLLLNVALEVAARISLGEIGSGVAGARGGADAGGAGGATIVVNELGRQRGWVVAKARSQAGAEVAQTWSASCRMSMSMPHEEHLIMGRPLALMRSMVGVARVSVCVVGCVDKGRERDSLRPSSRQRGVCESAEVTWDGRRDSNGSRVGSGQDGWIGREATLGGPRLMIAAG